MCIRYLCSKFGILLVVCFAIGSTSICAQTLYRFGQSVQPIFEGFEKNADGTFTLWFGYLNRNYDETPNIVIGDNNTFFAADGVDSAGPLDPSLFMADSFLGLWYLLILLVKSWYGRLVTMVKRAPR